MLLLNLQRLCQVIFETRAVHWRVEETGRQKHPENTVHLVQNTVHFRTYEQRPYFDRFIGTGNEQGCLKAFEIIH
jgi:hypothetical protein